MSVQQMSTMTAEEFAHALQKLVDATPPAPVTYGFNPAQARVRKGNRDGGQWLDTARGMLEGLARALGGDGRDKGERTPLVYTPGPRVPRTPEGMYDEAEPTSTADEDDVPDIRNDRGMSHEDLAEGSTDSKGRPYGADVEQRANEIHDQAIQAEPALTDAMRAAMKGSGGELAGLEYRIKNQSSLAKKIRGNVDKGKSMDEQVATDGIKDSVRYTAVFETKDYAKGSQDAIDRLRAAGYTVDVKSFYQGDEAGLAYKGVHGQMISPEGFKVELQFHTPASLEAKFAPEMHGIYDKQKLEKEGSPEWEDYEQQMRDYMTSIGFEMPPGADTIS